MDGKCKLIMSKNAERVLLTSRVEAENAQFNSFCLRGSEDEPKESSDTPSKPSGLKTTGEITSFSMKFRPIRGNIN